MTRKIELSVSERRAYRRFLAVLRKTVKRFHKRWEIDSSGELRLPANAAQAVASGFCPITAVCCAMGHGLYNENEFGLGGAKIGLSRRLAKRITEAADANLCNIAVNMCSTVRTHRKLDMRIRRDLLRAIGCIQDLKREEQELREDQEAA